MNEIELSKATPVSLRLSHADYFLTQYIHHSGPPSDSYWHMIAYFDAFLFTLASIYDISDPKVREKLKRDVVFGFFLTLRNVTAHHSVLAFAAQGSKFPRPFSREVSTGNSNPPQDSSRLFFRFDVLELILDGVEKDYPPAKKNIAVARSHIENLKRRSGRVYLDDLVRESLETVRKIVPNV